MGTDIPDMPATGGPLPSWCEPLAFAKAGWRRHRKGAYGFLLYCAVMLSVRPPFALGNVLLAAGFAVIGVGALELLGPRIRCPVALQEDRIVRGCGRSREATTYSEIRTCEIVRGQSVDGAFWSLRIRLKPGARRYFRWRPPVKDAGIPEDQDIRAIRQALVERGVEVVPHVTISKPST
jgi:hypothetical protein